MTRIKSIPIAIGAVLLSAGTVFAFTAMPLAPTSGVTKAGAADQTVPGQVDADGNDQGDGTDAETPETETPDAETPDAPDTETPDAPETDTPDAPETDTPDAGAPDTGGAPTAGTHGAAVSAVANAPDTTPDTNHGADVSAVARDNLGQANAAAKKAAHVKTHTSAKKPAHTGKPA